MENEQKSKHVITGIVVASRWNKDGIVDGISIQGYDEKEYIVKPNELGNKLPDVMNKTVRVTGKVSRAIDGRQTIQVVHFELFEIEDDVLQGCD